ncbi:hypothetical protein RDI58_017899 [Solanum bulbocastanum]|uniref:Xylanase inhibitor C-terminal domain-containing protein n=1 Tax=Solanum bulbocastanum TaxID=147425 RepID=A0AAN8TD64_SOLBU
MSIDPTKIPDPPMPSYNFALYNRGLFGKSKLKDYDPLLENRFARSQAIAKNLAMTLENSNMIGENGTLTRPHRAHKSKRDNGNVPKTTGLQFAYGQNQVSILFGCGRDQLSGSSFSRELSGIADLRRRVNNFGNDMTGGCFVDTGVTVTSFPQKFYIVFCDTFRKEVNIPKKVNIPVYDAPLGNFDTCYMVDPGVVPTFPVVKMYFDQQNPENLLLLEQKMGCSS